MSDDRAFERALNDWLEAGSDRTPPPALDAVLLAIRTTPQERALRVPWRNPIMSNSLRLAAAIAIVAVIGVAGALFFNRGPGVGTNPSPTPAVSATPVPSLLPSIEPSPTPIDTATWTEVTSARHGYATRYPSDWTFTPASKPASLAEMTAADVAVYDHFLAPGSPADEIMAVSAKLPAGVAEADWIAAYRQPIVDQFGEKCFPAPDAWLPVTVGGHQGGLYVGCNYVESTTFVDGRAYVFTVARPFGVPVGDGTEPLLRAFLSTVTIDAAAADDSPATP